MYNDLLFKTIDDEKLKETVLRYADQISDFERKNLLKNVKKCINKLIALGEQNDDKSILTYGYIRLSQHESKLLQYNNSIKHSLHALELSKGVDNDTLLFEVYLNLGLCFGKAGDIDKSLEYSLQANKFMPNNPKASNNIGIVYKQKKQYEQSLIFFNKSLDVFNKNKDDKFSAMVMLNIATIYLETDKTENAINTLNEVKLISERIGSKELLCNSLEQLGIAFFNQKKYIKAEKFLLDSLMIAKEIQSQQNKLTCYSSLSKLYKEIKDFEKALHYSTKYSNALELTIKKETDDKINKILIKAEITKDEQREKQLELEKSKQEIEKKFHYLQYAYSEITAVGQFGVFSSKMLNVVKMAELFHSDRTVPVLIEGETGTGKDIIAKIIHYGKHGNSDPIIVVNCAAISPTLFESELFGYEEGAFTGARVKGMVGKFEMAQGGTIFLDEIGELPLFLQPKLLRVLQQKEIYRIGGKTPIKLDVRVICATNRDLKKEMEENRFRKDLYFRLNTGRIFIPPLIERKDEIQPLSQMFLTKFSKLKKRNFQFISDEAIMLMKQYSWPGNVRELENAIERVTLLYNDVTLKPHHLNFLELANQIETPTQEEFYIVNLPEAGISLESIKKEIIEKVVKKFDGNKTKAASYLGIARNTVYNLIK